MKKTILKFAVAIVFAVGIFVSFESEATYPTLNQKYQFADGDWGPYCYPTKANCWA
jgi:hypothetical protein